MAVSSVLVLLSRKIEGFVFSDVVKDKVRSVLVGEIRVIH
jgi:hypothetical protein